MEYFRKETLKYPLPNTQTVQALTCIPRADLLDWKTCGKYTSRRNGTCFELQITKLTIVPNFPGIKCWLQENIATHGSSCSIFCRHFTALGIEQKNKARRYQNWADCKTALVTLFCTIALWFYLLCISWHWRSLDTTCCIICKYHPMHTYWLSAHFCR